VLPRLLARCWSHDRHTLNARGAQLTAADLIKNFVCGCAQARLGLRHLEAVEDHLRGWRNGKSGLGEERVARGKLAIEHVMPRKWHAHWSLQEGRSEADRDRIIHSLGNLTLLTGKLNSKVSNGPWLGTEGKRNGLEAHDVLVLNRELLKKSVEQWTDDAIEPSPSELFSSGASKPSRAR
jgi:Protein of unknown function (DUF1524)